MSDRINKMIEKYGIGESIKLMGGYDILMKVYGWSEDEIFNKYFNESHPELLYNNISIDELSDKFYEVYNSDGNVIGYIEVDKSLGKKTYNIYYDLIDELEELFPDKWNILYINWVNNEYSMLLKLFFGDNDWKITDI